MGRGETLSCHDFHRFRTRVASLYLGGEKSAAFGDMLCHTLCTQVRSHAHACNHSTLSHKRKGILSRHFQGPIWLKGLWFFFNFFLLRKALFLFSAPHSVSSSWEGYRLQKRALDMGYSSQVVPIPHVKIENRVLLTPCLWISSTAAVVLP